MESIADEEANGRGRSLENYDTRTDARTPPCAIVVSVTEFSCMRGRSSGKTGPPFSTGQARRRAGGLLDVNDINSIRCICTSKMYMLLYES